MGNNLSNQIIEFFDYYMHVAEEMFWDRVATKNPKV